MKMVQLKLFQPREKYSTMLLKELMVLSTIPFGISKNQLQLHSKIFHAMHHNNWLLSLVLHVIVWMLLPREFNFQIWKLEIGSISIIWVIFFLFVNFTFITSSCHILWISILIFPYLLLLGAYTLTAASNFNGFESPHVYYKIFTTTNPVESSWEIAPRGAPQNFVMIFFLFIIVIELSVSLVVRKITIVNVKNKLVISEIINVLENGFRRSLQKIWRAKKMQRTLC